jgi:hypothetical protein
MNGLFGDFNALQDDDGSQKGLVDQLMQLAGVQSQYQNGGANFPGSPADANAAMSQQQAAPIAVGDGYIMPRIGSQSAFSVPWAARSGYWRTLPASAATAGNAAAASAASTRPAAYATGRTSTTA